MLDMSESKYTLSARDFSVADSFSSLINRFSYTGVTLRVGTSDLTGDIIATVAVFNSANGKTGDVVQVYYLPVDEHPIDAIKSGLDSAVCGSCPLKPSNANACYVRKFHGPARVWTTFKASRYPLYKDLSQAEKNKVLSILKSKPIRLGAWGDPASDLETSTFLASLAPQITAYSHQWRANPQLKPFTMASVDTAEDYKQAKDSGWRTYRHTNEDSAFDNEIICPHKTHGTQCIDCGLCSGTNSGSDKDIVTKTLKKG